MLNSSWKVRTAWQQGSEQNAKFPEKMRKLNFLVNESLVSNFSQNTRIRQNLNMRFPMSLSKTAPKTNNSIPSPQVLHT